MVARDISDPGLRQKAMRLRNGANPAFQFIPKFLWRTRGFERLRDHRVYDREDVFHPMIEFAQRYGVERGLQRYRCVGYGRTFRRPDWDAAGAQEGMLGILR